MALIKASPKAAYIARRVLLIAPFIPPAREAPLSDRIDYLESYTAELFSNLFRIEFAIVQLLDLAEKQGVQIELMPQLISTAEKNAISALQPLLTRQNQPELSDFPSRADSAADIDGSIEESIASDIQRLLALLQTDSDMIADLKEEITLLRANTDFLLENTPTEIDARVNAAISALRSELISKFS